MLGFLKKLFGIDNTTPTAPAPYKVETPAPAPAQCGCGRSQSGLCVGLHKLTPEEWAVHTDNPNKATAAKPTASKKKRTFVKREEANVKAPASTRAPAKPRAKKVQ